MDNLTELNLHKEGQCQKKKYTSVNCMIAVAGLTGVMNQTHVKKRRVKKERHYLFYERRSGWVRDTQWSSVFIDLLR